MPDSLDLQFVLIPDAEFIIGSDLSRDKLTQDDEKPEHRLRVTDFYIMKYPVTNAQYRQFIEATGHRPPFFGWPDGAFPEDKADHPVVGVTFHDAVAFCEWASQVTGLPLRLPSEPEWEKAARGTDGRIYPWGNEWKEGHCNSYEARIGGTSPVGAFSPQGDSPYGVADMGGNVQEWCSSLFNIYPYDPTDGREILVNNPNARGLMPNIRETGCVANALAIEASIDKSVIRGGSWREAKVKSRCAYRGWAAPMHRSDDTGFRCVYEP
ncbi:MAG: formylglycine-generating enzyme family protein [Chloroflexi bacterium]|jgi:formylglycine-generating enzyme required for sulfatase activity|nr:formylglycine-generating enzyme family protein [Chloroflexota bacterium]